MFDDDIDAPAVRELADAPRKILGVVIDDRIRAEITSAGELLVGAGRGQHARSVQSCDLDRRLSHAAAGRQHEHIFARL